VREVVGRLVIAQAGEEAPVAALETMQRDDRVGGGELRQVQFAGSSASNLASLAG
jgi:hypothetical protein